MQKIQKKIRIMFLGGAYAQIPVLIEAKKLGLYVITCDYLPDNPGHKYADEYHNVNTTDSEGVLKLAKKVNHELVVAYASDPAAPVAAYVSNILDLPGNSYESVRILSEKDLFRKHLRDNGFNAPNIIPIAEKEDAHSKLRPLKFPFILKPNDSSGSKGVSLVKCIEEIDLAFKYALGFSRSRRIIAEEFIDNEMGDVQGDGFIMDGKLVFSFLGDHIYSKNPNPFNPVGTLWPSNLPMEFIKEIEKNVEEIINGCGFRNGPINIEAHVNSNGKIYIMEIGPRNGGHFVPQAIQYATGFNMARALLDLLLGNKITIPDQLPKNTAYFAIHSDKKGRLIDLSISPELKPFIREFHQYKFPGEIVSPFYGANAAIGILILSFRSRKEMESLITNIQHLIQIKIEI